MIVDGAAGVGVSRLLSEGAAMANDLGCQVYRGRCYEHIDVPYFPLLDTALPALADAVKLDSELERYVGVIDRVLGRPGETAEPAVLQALLPQLTSALIELAVRQPLALVIDDLQWADQATLDLLVHVAARLDAEATTREIPFVALVGTRMSIDGTESVVRRLRREPACESVHVRGLNTAECAVFLRSEGFGEASTRLAEPIFALTGGNPLWIRILSRELHEQAEGAGDVEQLTAEAIDRLAPAGGLEAGIEQRVTELSEGCRRLLAAAATAGTAASLDLLAQLPGLHPSELEKFLREAEDAGIVSVLHGAVEFDHPLFRRSARAGLSARESCALHEWVASTLLSEYGEGHEELLPAIAHHLFHAGDEVESRELLRYAAQAARWSASTGAWEQAARLFDHAINAAERLDEPDDPQTLAELYLGAGHASSRSGADETAVDRLTDAAARFEEIGDVIGHARSILVCHRVLLRSPRFTTTRRGLDLESIIKGVAPLDPAVATELRGVLAEGYLLDAEVDKARHWAEMVAADAERMDLPDAISIANTILGFLHTAELELDDATRHLEAAAESSDKVSDPWLAANALYSLSLCHFLSGDLDGVQTRTDELLALCERVGDDGPRDLAMMVRMARAIAIGDPVASELMEDEALLLDGRTGRGMIRPLLYPTVAARRAYVGDRLGAMEALDRWSGSEGVELRALDATRAWVHAEFGDHEPARKILTTLPPFSEAEEGMITRPALAAAMLETSFRLGLDHESESALKIVQGARDRGQLFASSMALFLPHVDGLGQAALGATDGAIETLREARVAAQLGGYESVLARINVDLAQLILSEDPEALPTLEPLLEEAAEIAKRADLESVTQRLRALGAIRRTPHLAGAQTRFVFFADVCGSTRLGRELGDREYFRRARRLESILLAAVGSRGGEVQPGVSLGDGICAVFLRVEDAIEAGLTAVRRSAAAGLQIHVGIHVGEVTFDKDRLYGTAVNTAARFCDAAEPDMVAVSDAVRKCLTKESGIELRFRGEHDMKGLAGPLGVFEVVPGQTGGDR